MMKDLYQPVFWCGFALSLSALYYSSEQAAKEANTPTRKPVLMRISFDEFKDRNVQLGTSQAQPVENKEESSELPTPRVDPAGVNIDLGASEDPFLPNAPNVETHDDLAGPSTPVGPVTTPPSTPTSTPPSAPTSNSSFLSAARKALEAP
ncbi:hypothetical protein [Thalassoglobus polymorphus]|uniref:Uncharacterized protein n=1 Tax=Thalassoglobus polymorphus TaxID=2527994 RepID=A0A517QIF2_9PLAN|nr:hypothetical protein [Thalassoglobus polymorphus]QDT31416.1 hypothetical protein Mal48_06490 [Thalassoglobus polymorphus]